MRSMSIWCDIIKWVSGYYSLEVAKPEDIFIFYRDQKFVFTGVSSA